jgi:DNA-binding LacI/PurR family transcriptional regulator
MADATIYDVSELAQVSIATVSRVLNSPDKVSEETRARVIAAIDELRFVPKFEALARARKAVGRIGILTPSFTSDSFVDRLRGIVAALAGMPYEPIIYDVNSAAQRDGYLTSLPASRQVDGLIAIDLPIDDATAGRLLEHGLPTVQIVPSMQVNSSHNLTRIVHDDTVGGRMAAEYLLAQGHRRLGYVGDTDLPEFLGTSRDRKLDSFRQALALQRVTLPDAYVQLGPFGMESARQLALPLLDLPSPPTAIFAGSDTQAIGVLSAVRESGLKAPEDVAVMGFDDIAVAEYIGLTTIRQQLRESGRLAVTLLLEQLEEGRGSDRSVSMPYTLMRRVTA